MFASDDFISPSKWDRYLIDKLKDKKGTLIVRDGYQALDFSNMLYPCVTIPIMTYSCLKELNMIIYNQVYNHMFSDNELYLNLKEMNLLIDDRIADTTTFKHMHHSTGDRSADMCDHVYYSKWADDKTMWEKRRLLTLNERLK